MLVVVLRTLPYLGSVFGNHVHKCHVGGAEALKLVPELKPDLILLDIEMPLMDGLTFLRHARSSFVGKILVLSAVTGLVVKECAIEHLVALHNPPIPELL